MKVCGSDAFIYSSDFPHEVTRDTVRSAIEEILENDEMTAADKEAILSKNATRFYRRQPAG